MSNPLRDMEHPDVIFCIGTNMTECHPVAATRLKRALARGAKLIVADPRRIGLAELADLYLPLRGHIGSLDGTYSGKALAWLIHDIKERSTGGRRLRGRPI